MKSLIITILLFPVLVYAQTFKHAFFVGSNFSYYFSNNSEMLNPKDVFPSFKYWGIGIPGGYNLEYNFPKTLIFGVSFQYLNTEAKFYTSCYCIHPIDRVVSIRNTVNTHNIDMPMYFKLKTNKLSYTYFTSGLGISWLFSAHRKVENEVWFLNQEKPERTEIVNESFILRNKDNNSFGTFFQIGIGQTFQIKRANLFAELSYRQGINFWVYETYETPDGIKEFPIKLHGINLKIGMFLNSIGEKKE